MEIHAEKGCIGCAACSMDKSRISRVPIVELCTAVATVLASWAQLPTPGIAVSAVGGDNCKEGTFSA